MVSQRRPVRHVVWRATTDGEQLLPVNVFDTHNDLVITAPMPGVEPENIEVSVAGRTLQIRATRRGPGQNNRDYLHHEWTYGPYFRRLELPSAVEAERANASFGNGVLTLTLPKIAAGQLKQITVERIGLEKTGTAEGHRTGHTGHHAIAGGQHGPLPPNQGG